MHVTPGICQDEYLKELCDLSLYAAVHMVMQTFKPKNCKNAQKQKMRCGKKCPYMQFIYSI